MRSFRFVTLVAGLVASAAFAAKPVLKVNDSQLTDTDLKLAQQVVGRQIQGQAPGAKPTQEIVMRHAVDQLIGTTLLLQAAHEAKITVDPVSVAAAVDQQRTRGGDAAFQKFLTDQGLTEQEFTRKVEDQMSVRKFVETAVASKVVVTDADAKAFYDANPAKFEHPEELKLRAIVIKAEPNAGEKLVAAVKERAEATRKRVLQGEDFATVAKDVSDDPTKARGGELGWVRKGMLWPDMEPAVWALKPGEVSEVLKSSYGFHIFKLEERRVPGKLPFDEVKPKLTEILKNEKLLAALDALVKERRARAKIEALDPDVKAALETPLSQPGTQPAATTKPSPSPASNAPKQP